MTAIREEFDGIAPRVSSRAPAGDGPVLRGEMGRARVTLVLTGDGPRNAESALSDLLRDDHEGPPTAVLGLGVAGALSPDLELNALVVGTAIRDETGGAAPRPEPFLVERARRAGARGGTLVTVAAPVCSSMEKRGLASSLALSKEAPGAVDMEAAGWARAAAAARVPFVVVRAISDGIEDDLPAFLARCLGQDGGIDRGAVARNLLVHPGALPRLLATRRRVSAAAVHLADFAERFLAGA